MIDGYSSQNLSPAQDSFTSTNHRVRKKTNNLVGLIVQQDLEQEWAPSAGTVPLTPPGNVLVATTVTACHRASSLLLGCLLVLAC